MSHGFAELMFTPRVKALQEEAGSREFYARFASADAADGGRLGDAETRFIASRDSFYLASISESGWPYVQHRGGAAGFLKVLDKRKIGFADYRGNRQYVSVGNLLSNDRVSMFLMDYPNRRRLKLLGRAHILSEHDDTDLLNRLRAGSTETVERGIVIALEGFDWNCSQYITPRFTETELAERLAPFAVRLQALEAENEMLRRKRSAG